MKKLYTIMLAAVFSILLGLTCLAEQKVGVPQNLLGKDKLHPFSGCSTDIYSDLKSSNEKVLTLQKTKRNGMVWVTAKIKKTGKATVSFKSNDEQEKFTVYVVKYANPFKSLKIGNKNYASKFKKSFAYHKIPLGTSGKLKFSIKKGWKLVNIYKMNTSTAAVAKKIKKGSKVKFAKKDVIEIDLKNKKDGFVWAFYLTCKAF